MMEKKKRTHKSLFRVLSVLLSVCLFSGAVLLMPRAATSASAATVRLPMTEGAVEVTDSAGKPMHIVGNMRLSNGSHTITGERSYAWFNLDDTKALKEDAVSEVEVRKNGKKLEVLLDSGSLYFNVTAPLQGDEGLNIRTSTMVMGIRGTSGWVKVIDGRITRVWLLTGEVECIVTNPINGQTKRIILRAGDEADFYVYDPARPVDQADIIIRRFVREDIDGYVLKDLVGETEHIQKIYDESGIDLRNLTDPEADARLAADQQRVAEELAVVREAEGQQESRKARDPVWEHDQEPEMPMADSSDDSDDDTPASNVITLTMPVTATVVQGYLNDSSVKQVILQPGADPTQNTLQVDIDFTVPTGKTLTANNGVPVNVNAGTQTDVNGTADLGDTLENNGTVNVNSSDTLKVAKMITNAGSFVNQSTGHTVASGGFTNTGSGGLTNRGVFDGTITGVAYFGSEGGTFNGDVTVSDGWFTMSGGTVKGKVNVSGDSYVMLKGGAIFYSGSDSAMTLAVDDYSKVSCTGGTVTNNSSGPALAWTATTGTLDPGSTEFRTKSGASAASPALAGWQTEEISGWKVLTKIPTYTVTVKSYLGTYGTHTIGGAAADTAEAYAGDTVNLQVMNSDTVNMTVNYEIRDSSCNILSGGEGQTVIAAGGTWTNNFTMPAEAVTVSLWDDDVDKILRLPVGGTDDYKRDTLNNMLVSGASVVHVRKGVNGENTFSIAGGWITVPAGVTLEIEDGVVITVQSGAGILNNGTIDNYGTLTISSGGTFTNNGTYNNYGGHTFNNYGTVVNGPEGLIRNGDGDAYNGVFNNLSQDGKAGVIRNSGVIENSAGSTFRNEGILVEESPDAVSPEFAEGSAPVIALPGDTEEYAESDGIYSGQCGEGLYWYLREAEEDEDTAVTAAEEETAGTASASDAEKEAAEEQDDPGAPCELHILGTGELEDYQLEDGRSTAPWFDVPDCVIRSVILDSGIRRIGRNAFYGIRTISYVRFLGDEAGWKRIPVRDGNEVLGKTVILIGADDALVLGDPLREEEEEERWTETESVPITKATGSNAER